LASDFHDLDNLGDPDKDVAISCSSRFVARLYDQKFFASSHHNINKLTGRDASLVRLPPSEAAYSSCLIPDFLPFPKKDMCARKNSTCDF
jgi:hypothetical protein